MPQKKDSKNFSINSSKKETNRIIKAVHKNEGQRDALKIIDENTVTILTGFPGSGKTYLAVSYGLQMLIRGTYDKLIFTRPVVEAGEHLGYLPGDFEEKIAPYMIPIFDVIGDHLSLIDLKKMIEDKKIIVLPLAYMRGSTFKNAYVVLDEAQNATSAQIKLFLTRIGENSKVVLTGDLHQSDIGSRSGLSDAIQRLKGVPNLGISHLDASCVVRDPIVVQIEQRYSKPLDEILSTEN